MIKIIDLKNNKLKITNESSVNQKLIIPYLERRKFRYERVEARNSNGQGMPDFIIRWKKKFIFVEVKYGDNILSPKQRQWFAKYNRDCFCIIYRQGQLYIYDSKQILLLIKEGKI